MSRLSELQHEGSDHPPKTRQLGHQDTPHTSQTTCAASLPAITQELFDMVLDDVLPYDFERLALVCKEVYGKCKSRLNAHNKYRAVFRHVRFRPEGDVSLWMDRHTKSFALTSQADLLGRIADDPRISRWIESIALQQDEKNRLVLERSNVTIAGATLHVQIPDMLRYSDGTASARETYRRCDLSDLLIDSPRLLRTLEAEIGLEPGWDSIARTDFPRKISSLPLLMCLLPNVKCVGLNDVEDERWRPWEKTLLKCICEAATEEYDIAFDTSPRGPFRGSLSKLARLDVDAVTSDDHALLARLWLLPTVVSLKPTDAAVYYSKGEDRTELTMKLVSMSMDHSEITTTEAASMLAQMTSLQRFQYYGSTNNLDRTAKVLGELLHRRGEHITAIELLDNGQYSDRWSRPANPSGIRMCQFSALRRLVLAERYILRSMLDPNRKFVAPGPKTPQPLFDERLRGKVLVHFLTPTLHTFCILGKGFWTTAMAIDVLFYDFVNYRPKFPTLQHVIITRPRKADRFFARAAVQLHDTFIQTDVKLDIWRAEMVSGSMVMCCTSTNSNTVCARSTHLGS